MLGVVALPVTEGLLPTKNGLDDHAIHDEDQNKGHKGVQGQVQHGVSHHVGVTATGMKINVQHACV